MTEQIKDILVLLQELVEMANENKLPQSILDAIYFQPDIHIAVEVGVTWEDDELIFMFICWSHLGDTDSVYLTKEQLYLILLEG